MGRIVLLAREFNNTLERLAEANEEVNGVLLYRQQEEYCPVEAIFMTGVGTSGHVREEQGRIDLLNVFFRNNPDYRIVKFHTHSLGTIRDCGEYWADHFSSGDIALYKRHLVHNPELIGMVITPTTKLLYAPDKPTLRIVNGFPSEANQRIHRELRDIAGELGYDMDKLKATRRR